MKSIKEFLITEEQDSELKSELNNETPKKLSVKAKNIGRKLIKRLYGGDFNELASAMENGDTKLARQICNDINYYYRSKVFSSDQITFLIDNWAECLTGMQWIYQNEI